MLSFGDMGGGESQEQDNGIACSYHDRREPAPINGTGGMKDIGINFIGSVHFGRPVARQ